VRIPNQWLFFNRSIPLPQSMTDPSSFLIVIYNIIGFSQAASQSSILRIILGHLLPILRHKYRSTNICHLFLIWVDTFHVSHPYSSTDLTLLLHVVLLATTIFLFFHDEYKPSSS
jgi:hypothetical protein